MGKWWNLWHFIFLCSTADDDCNHEIKRCLLLGRTDMTNIGSILKSRNTSLPTKVCLVKAMVFPVVMYGCESWTIKKAESWRMDAFKLWCWKRLSRVPWTARRSNQSILKEICPEYSLERLKLKLKLQYFDYLMQRTDSLEKTLILGKIEGRRGWQKLTWLDGGKDPDSGKDWRQEEKGMTQVDMVGWHHRISEHEFEQALGVGDGQGSLACCSPWGCKELDWTTEMNWYISSKLCSATEFAQ